MEEKVINPIDALFDPNNNEPIVLYNDKDEPVVFEQIAVIGMKGKNYAILQPVDRSGLDIDEDEAFAFEIVEDEENGDSLVLVEDDALIDEVFDHYRDLYKEAKKK